MARGMDVTGGRRRLLLFVLLLSIFTLTSTSAALAAASGSVRRCPADAIGFPQHLRNGTIRISVSRRLSTGDRCIKLGASPSAGTSALERVQSDLRAAVLSKRRFTYTERLRALVAKVTGVATRQGGAAPANAEDATSAPTGAGDGGTHSGIEKGVHFTVKESHSSNPDDQLGMGDDDSTATATTSAQGATVTVHKTLRTRDTIDKCPTAAGIVQGTLENDEDTVTTTMVAGKGTLTQEVDTEVRVDFTGHVNDNALLSSVDTVRVSHEVGKATFEPVGGGGATHAFVGTTDELAVPDEAIGAHGSPDSRTHGQPDGHTTITIDDPDKGQVGSQDFDDAASGFAGAGLAAGEASTLLRIAEENWYDVNSGCAKGVVTGGDQKPEQGGSLHFTALMNAKRGGVVPASFTVSDDCHAPATPRSAKSTSTPASFDEQDSDSAWGTARSPTACLLLAGVSRAGRWSGGVSLNTPRIFDITYQASMDYSLNRENDDYLVAGAAPAVLTFEQSTHLVWTTTYAPVTITGAYGATGSIAGAVESDGTDALSGYTMTHTVASNTVNGDMNQTCESTSEPSEAGDGPEADLTPGDANGFTIEVSAVGVAQYNASCDDGSTPELVAIDSDEDPTLSDASLENTVTVSYARLNPGTRPLVIPVAGPQSDIDDDCADPADSLVSCTSELAWKGSITFKLAP